MHDLQAGSLNSIPGTVLLLESCWEQPPSMARCSPTHPPSSEHPNTLLVGKEYELSDSLKGSKQISQCYASPFMLEGLCILLGLSVLLDCSTRLTRMMLPS